MYCDQDRGSLLRQEFGHGRVCGSPPVSTPRSNVAPYWDPARVLVHCESGRSARSLKAWPRVRIAAHRYIASLSPYWSTLRALLRCGELFVMCAWLQGLGCSPAVRISIVASVKQCRASVIAEADSLSGRRHTCRCVTVWEHRAGACALRQFHAWLAAPLSGLLLVRARKVPPVTDITH